MLQNALKLILFKEAHHLKNIDRVHQAEYQQALAAATRAV